ncbi:MAG: hypothetical protein J6J24_00345 [Clostridia bacterium]|nr:hypothetical protein [Clostridia bacterium]
MAKKPGYSFENLTKEQQSCLSLIESLGIYELRALARVFGDNSPTTLKRDDHIKIVMNKIISKEDLKPIPLRQGRPYKELSNIEGILSDLSAITGQNYLLRENQSKLSFGINNKIVSFKQVEEKIMRQKLFPIEVKGVLRERNADEFYFIEQTNQKLILVRKDLDYRLQEGDFIVGTAIVMNEEKEYILDSVEFVNYKSISRYEVNDSPYLLTMPSEKVEFNNKNILLGGRYLLSEKLTEMSDLKDLLKKLNANKIVTIALVPNVFYEDIVAVTSLGFNNTFLLRYDDRPSTNYDSIILMLEHINRLQQLGYSIALFVEDPVTLASIIDYAFNTISKPLVGHSENAVETLKQIVMLARAGENNKSTTLFMTQNESDMTDCLFVSSIYKVSKKLN